MAVCYYSYYKYEYNDIQFVMITFISIIALVVNITYSLTAKSVFTIILYNYVISRVVINFMSIIMVILC